ncbi:MAG: endo-1,4-beta-xylanase, partial [Limisphaerales bacterium]
TMRMRRRSFLRLATPMAGGLPWISLRPKAHPAGWMENPVTQAAGAIPRLRTSAVTARIVDGNALPLHGTQIQITQLEHAFPFGVTAFRWGPEPTPTDPLQAAYRQRLTDLFNAATLGFYWHTYEPSPGRPNHDYTDAVAKSCLAHCLRLKGHPLAWANLPDPSWLPDQPADIRQASLARTRDLVSRFKGRIDTWDVINEPSLLMWANTRLGDWAQSVGSQSYVRQHLEAAREANPTATLLVNEVLTQYPVYPLLDALRDADDRPLYDGVGLQSHMHMEPWSLTGVWKLCNRYAQLGVPLHFSEVTVLSGERLPGDQWGPSRFEYEILQRDYVPQLYTLLFGHPAIQSITWWDLSDRAAWKGAAAGLLRDDMSPKPAYEQLLDLIKRQWWTRVEGRTNPHGEFQFRAFHGRHRITLTTLQGRQFQQEFSSHPGRDTHLEIQLPKA